MNRLNLYIIVALMFTLGLLGIQIKSFALETPKAYLVDISNDTIIGERFNIEHQSYTFRLIGEVPSGKMLKAWRVSMSYDPQVISIERAISPNGSEFKQTIINTNIPGKIIANAFDVNGVEGPTSTLLLDLIIKGGKSGETTLSISFDNYGTINNEEFKPDRIKTRLVIQ